MGTFNLKDSSEYYLELSETPKRFDADSPVTNVFFDDTNGQVFTVRSGGVTGVTVSGMDETKSTSFRMEDRGPIISIKFSLDHKILAIQRNRDHQNASVEFMNFQDLKPTNIEYAHTCRWKNAKILGFVWPKANEIAFVTDHGIELLLVLPEKKTLKSLKNTTFSGAWFSWCAQSKMVVLAGNNGTLLQPFLLNNSTITKLQKLELEAGKPVAERDLFVLRVRDAAWCAVFRHGASAAVAAPGPTEVWLLPVGAARRTHVLQTGQAGRFAVNVADDLVVVHHQSSQTSQLFDIMEETKQDSNIQLHVPIVPGISMRPALVGDQPCPMYAGTWVVFQPDYMVDARLGALWRLRLAPAGLAHQIPNDEISKIAGVLLRRSEGRKTLYSMLTQLVGESSPRLLQITKAFDEVNAVYRKWIDMEVARNTAGLPAIKTVPPKVVISQNDMCTHVLQVHTENKFIVQVMTAYLASLSRYNIPAAQSTAELCSRGMLAHGAPHRLSALVRRGCLADAKPLACQLLSLGHLDAAAAQLALDMMWRLRAHEEIVEVLLSCDEPIAAVGAARQAGAGWLALPARKLLAAAAARGAGSFAALYHALRARPPPPPPPPHHNDQCDAFEDYYKQVTSD